MDSYQLLHQVKVDNILHRYKYHKDAMIEQIKILRKTSLTGLEEITKQIIKEISR